ncbi:MAG: DUF3791 domain-containing protein [Coriobacteriales bacterium]|jgi:hypothetical protein|nr:DUF3791 domain-containing protein [Coriobacteriales bacterium]
MIKAESNKIAYLVACVGEFAKSTGMTQQEAFRYLRYHKGLDFLSEHYEAEHMLSLEEAIADLKMVTKQAGGMVV